MSPQAVLNTLKTLVKVCLVAIFATQVAVAAVASTTFKGGLTLSWDLFAVSLGLCLLSAVASLLNRLRVELKANNGELPGHLTLLCAASITGSALAGALAFVVAQAADLDVWKMLASLILASFGGALFVEKKAEGLYTAAMPTSGGPP